MINDEDAKIAAAVQLCLPEIARTIDLMAPRVLKGGRVIYIGAGTSGRCVYFQTLRNLKLTDPGLEY